MRSADLLPGSNTVRVFLRCARVSTKDRAEHHEIGGGSVGRRSGRGGATYLCQQCTDSERRAPPTARASSAFAAGAGADGVHGQGLLHCPLWIASISTCRPRGATRLSIVLVAATRGVSGRQSVKHLGARSVARTLARATTKRLSSQIHNRLPGQLAAQSRVPVQQSAPVRRIDRRRRHRGGPSGIARNGYPCRDHPIQWQLRVEGGARKVSILDLYVIVIFWGERGRRPRCAAVTFWPSAECMGFSGAPRHSRTRLALSDPRAIFGVDAPQIKKFSVQKVSSVRAAAGGGTAIQNWNSLLALVHTHTRALSLSLALLILRSPIGHSRISPLKWRTDRMTITRRSCVLTPTSRNLSTRRCKPLRPRPKSAFYLEIVGTHAWNLSHAYAGKLYNKAIYESWSIFYCLTNLSKEWNKLIGIFLNQEKLII